MELRHTGGVNAHADTGAERELAGTRPVRPGLVAWIPRRWAIASVVANIGIVVTGGAVRVTASGLGCPTWPRCTEDSFIPTGQAGAHEAIEFGNRMLTFLLVMVAIGTLVTVWRIRPLRPRARMLAVVLAIGIPAQAVIGGISVLTDLNPWVVSGHLLLSMVLIGFAVLLFATLGEDQGLVVHPVVRLLAVVVLAATALVVWIGTVTTGSGPHAGDAAAPRTGLDLQLMAQFHADAVFLLVGVTIATVVVTRYLAPRVFNAAAIVLGVQLVQATVGYTQWFTGLPAALVVLHLLGAGMAVATATNLYARTRVSEFSDGAPTLGTSRQPA